METCYSDVAIYVIMIVLDKPRGDFTIKIPKLLCLGLAWSPARPRFPQLIMTDPQLKIQKHTCVDANSFQPCVFVVPFYLLKEEDVEEDEEEDDDDDMDDAEFEVNNHFSTKIKIKNINYCRIVFD